MKRTLLVTTAIVLAASTPIFAEGGFYLGALVGGVVNQNQDLDGSAGGLTISLDGGADLSIFGGYDFGKVGKLGSLRTELQFSGRASETDGATEGTYTEEAVFLNVLHDFTLSEQSKWVPYLGAGIGHGKLEYDDYRANGTTLLNGSDEVWGGQLILGLGYQLTEGARVFADYRYRNWADTKVSDVSGRAVSIDNASSSINFGAAYTF
ncbi:outer membrane protein [Meridianimarinicoccus aquatilis]|uniref:Porin family protein n=1 Tax=Meridianimarinicoccus aquatilis TaxID=2552766 RepID=A0A4R6B2U4_9RHOB|nr:outer membrane beta-barrel protein [Fluviibacterium aquatile]QIE43232.1 porin family protein [Rhodobacteraceae bacterium SC52]TDL90525.1 porin family protein [Fluviibacterium aquatile]